MSDKSFRVSPLLADAAKEVFAGERLRELHISVARAFAEGWMSPQEGAQAFEHAWEAKLILALRGMVESLFSESRAVFDAVSAQVSWFIAEGLKEGEVLLPNDRHVSLLLRLFLLRIAAGNLPALAFPALRAWRAEIEQGEPQARPSARYLLAIEALGHGEIVLSAKDTVEYLGMLFDLGAGDADLRAMADEQMANVPPNIAREMRHESPAGLQAVLSFNRCRSVAWLDDGLTALEAASPALRENILHAARLNPWWCGMMIDATWLDEEAKVQPDWPRCLAVLERASQLGTQWRVEPWVFPAVRAAPKAKRAARDASGASRASRRVLMESRGGMRRGPSTLLRRAERSPAPRRGAATCEATRLYPPSLPFLSAVRDHPPASPPIAPNPSAERFFIYIGNAVKGPLMPVALSPQVEKTLEELIRLNKWILKSSRHGIAEQEQSRLTHGFSQEFLVERRGRQCG
jgi:hypothetical protein